MCLLELWFFLGIWAVVGLLGHAVVLLMITILTGENGEVLSHCHFDLYFPDDGNVEHLFIYLLAICLSSLDSCLLIKFFVIGLYEFFGYVILKIFPFQWAAFSFCWWFPLLCKTSLV